MPTMTRQRLKRMKKREDILVALCMAIDDGRNKNWKTYDTALSVLANLDDAGLVIVRKRNLDSTDKEG